MEGNKLQEVADKLVDEIRSSKQFYCISDLHLADRSKKDDFVQNEDKFGSWLEAIEGKKIILVGDILELWQCEFEEIVKAYEDLIKKLFGKTYFYIVGNHDQDMLDITKDSSLLAISLEFCGIPVVEKCVIGNTLFMHGHQFDPVNARFKGVGNWISKVGGWLEKYIDKDIDVKFMGVEKWVQKVGRFGSPEACKESAVNFVKDFKVDNRKIDTVVLGHSHIKDSAMVDGITYKNCGTLTGVWNPADVQTVIINDTV